tara:strand:- start:411 stop:575 length:165 start_codon:yes stop_codon:yes gene_type:complete
MKLEEVQKEVKDEGEETKITSVHLTLTDRNFLKKNNIVLRKLVAEAIKELREAK